MMKVLGDKKQSNGCNVPVTWFAMFYHSGERWPCAVVVVPGHALVHFQTEHMPPLAGSHAPS